MQQVIRAGGHAKIALKIEIKENNRVTLLCKITYFEVLIKRNLFEDSFWNSASGEKLMTGSALVAVR